MQIFTVEEDYRQIGMRRVGQENLSFKGVQCVLFIVQGWTVCSLGSEVKRIVSLLA